MKIVHIADVHWRGLSRHDEYRQSFEDFFIKCKNLNPDVIYVGGDIVHSKTQGISPELIDNLSWWFTGLASIAPTHIILGNFTKILKANYTVDGFWSHSDDFTCFTLNYITPQSLVLYFLSLTNEVDIL